MGHGGWRGGNPRPAVVSEEPSDARARPDIDRRYIHLGQESAPEVDRAGREDVRQRPAPDAAIALR